MNIYAKDKTNKIYINYDILIIAVQETREVLLFVRKIRSSTGIIKLPVLGGIKQAAEAYC